MADFEDVADEEWRVITKRLTIYASCRLARLHWRGLRVKAGQSVVKGNEACDLAADAILSVIDGTRTWNRVAYPDLYEFLKGAVDSKVSALVESAENRKSRLAPVNPKTGEPATADEFPSGSLTPAQIIEDADWKEKFQSALVKELSTDELCLGMFDCLHAGITDRSEMAEMLEVTVADIYNAQKRMNRKIEAVTKRLEQGKKP